MGDTNVAYSGTDNAKVNISYNNLNLTRNINGDESKNNTNPEFKFEQAKKILYFTSYFGMKDWMFGFGNQPFVDHKCPVTNCYITNKRNGLRKYMLLIMKYLHTKDILNLMNMLCLKYFFIQKCKILSLQP